MVPHRACGNGGDYCIMDQTLDVAILLDHCVKFGSSREISLMKNYSILVFCIMTSLILTLLKIVFLDKVEPDNNFKCRCV